MSNYNALKSEINNNIYENQTQQITGTVLNTVLNAMTASLGAGYQFAGVATVTTDPGTPDQRVFYVAGEGIYSHFNNLQVPEGNLGFLKWDSQWRLETIEGLGGGSNLTGYVSVATIADLPSEGQPTLGYLVGTNLYVYVGTGGDTADGKYQNCGSFRGPQGIQGDEGNGIASVVQTTTSTEDEGVNIITVTMDDNTQATFQVKNGSKGSQGIQGPQGVQGEPGRLQAQYKQVETLPTASADTVDYIYLVESDTPNVYDMYYTEENQGSYSWQSLGTTAVQLSDYATKAELSQLEAEVHTLAGKYYGIFEDESDLPEDADTPGYAFVGATEPFAVWNWDGEEWADTGVKVTGVAGEPGVGFQSIATLQDGTMIITLSNGDTITIDLNHNHPQYGTIVAGDAQPAGGFLPDVVYKLGTITGTVTFSLASAVTGNINHYFWTFDTDSTAPTITWPAGLTWADGAAPTVSASKHYEISVLNGIAYYSEV